MTLTQDKPEALLRALLAARLREDLYPVASARKVPGYANYPGGKGALCAAIVATVTTDADADAILARLASGPSTKGGPDMADRIAAAIRDSLGGVDEQRVRDICRETIAEETAGTVTIKYEAPAAEPRTVKGARPELERVLRRCMARVNVLLVGPAGCGKTHAAEQVAEAMGLPFGSVSLTAGASESVLLGWRLPVDGGAWQYTPSPFVRLYEGGGVFLFDEIDAADANMLLAVNQALANGRFFLPWRQENPEVKRHADFVAIAAANTWGSGADAQYVGRERLDESTLDRFRAGVIPLDYDTALERRLGHEQVIEWAHPLRKAMRKGQIQRVLSTRFILDASRCLQAGCTLKDVQDSFFAPWTEAERRAVAE